MKANHRWILAIVTCCAMAKLSVATADPILPKPKNPIPVDVGKGIEAKLDQLLDAIKSLTLDALKAAYFQGVFHGVLASALLFTLIIAFTRRGAP
jgi:hypothetical protein